MKAIPTIITLVLLGLLVTSCGSVDTLYVDLWQATLPPPTGGRTLHIPALDVHVEVITFPLGATTWEISPWERDAGHFEHTAWIDFPGNTVIGGHSEYPSGAPGIFHAIDTLRSGDVVFVRDGSLERRYVVTENRTVDYRDLSVLYPTTDSRLTLITCSIPSYVVRQNRYYERVVVVAVEVGEAR